MRIASALLAATLLPVGVAGAATYDEQPAAKRAMYTGIAVVANVVPVFAAMSTIAAADQLVLSGGGDMPQTRGILHRGFTGDWWLTGRHVSGDVEPQVLPEPPPPPSTGGWQPPPL
jgi:hypothetical protein